MTISNLDDIIDSRDIIARIAELQSDRDALQEAIDNAENDEYRQQAEKDLAEWVDAEELADLESLANECEGYGDWDYGETLIRETYWIEYVQELLADTGDIPRNIPDYIVIDWEATANNLEADYARVDFGGVEYLIRT